VIEVLKSIENDVLNKELTRRRDGNSNKNTVAKMNNAIAFLNA